MGHKALDQINSVMQFAPESFVINKRQTFQISKKFIYNGAILFLMVKAYQKLIIEPYKSITIQIKLDLVRLHHL